MLHRRLLVLPHLRTVTTTATSTTLQRLSLTLSSPSLSHRPIPTLASRCDVLPSPSSFYDSLLSGVERASRSITLISLYLGTGEKETRLVRSLRDALSSRPSLEVSVLLDGSRASRPVAGGDSVAALRSLSLDFPDRFRLVLFRMPQLWGSLSSRLPPRWIEILATQHVKAYAFDDDVIVTGANLSADYFETRQDRYTQFRRVPALAAMYRGLVDTLAPFSDVADENGTPRPPSAPRDRALRGRLRDALHDFVAQQPIDVEEDHTAADTWIVPRFQAGELDLRDDQDAVMRALGSAERADVATGYFNMSEDVIAATTGANAPSTNVLVCSPEAHGFYTANGISSALPLAYAERVRAYTERARGSRAAVYEYRRDGWTYHAKGLWCTAADEATPWLTSLGSSNLGIRSFDRDIESQVYVATACTSLRDTWAAERDALWSYATLVDDALWEREDRRLSGWSWRSGAWIRPVSRLVSRFM